MFSKLLLLSLCVLSTFSDTTPAPHTTSQPDGTFMTFIVEPRVEECFYEEIKFNEPLNMEFEVIKGGLLDIDFKLKNEMEQVLYQRMAFFNHKEDEKNEAEGHIIYNAPKDGVYGLCFDNTMSRWTAKTISVFIATQKSSATQIGSPDSKHDMATLEHLSPFVESVVHIGEELDSVERVQHHMRVREAVHRETAESTNSRVMWLAILESVVLLSISVFQLAYIRNWFADTDRRRRV